MDDRFLYGEEVQLHRGAFVKIYETARDDYDRETTCDGAFEDDAESAALSWTDEYVDLPEVDSLLDSATPSGIQSEADSVTLMQGQRPESVDGSDPPTTLSTRRTDSEGLCAGYSVRGPIEQAPHYQSQAQQVEDLRIWLADLLGTDPPVTLFVFEGLGADVTTHQIVFTHTTLSDAARFPIWLQRELRTLWRGQARIFPLQSAPYHDLRIAVLLQAAYGHELPVLLEIHQLQDTWREIHVVTQAVTINSLVWRSRLPQIVPETQQYQVALSGELAGPGDLIPWAPGQWLSIVVGPLGHYHGEDTTASSLNPSLPSLSTLAASQAASSSLDTPVAGLTGDPLEGPILAPLLPEIGESDYPRVAEDDLSFLFQIQVSGRAHEWLRGPRPWLERDEPLQRERRRFLEWRRKVDITRRTTRFYSFDYFAHEATAFLAAREQWPDFVIYSTKDEQITHWGLAVDQYFVLERFDFATVVRDYLRSVIPFHTKVALIPVKPWPGLHEQQGEDDLFLLVDEDPVCDAIPVMVSLWVREGDRAPELSARGPSTYTSGESITMPTGTYCRFEFYAPEEAAELLLDLPPHVDYLEIFTDGSFSTGNGDYNINPSDRQLRLLRALVQAYQTSAANSSRLSWEHVKGHSGNLGNEMADIFAKNAFLGQQELRDQPRPDYAPFVFGYRFPIESFWLYYCNLAPGTPLLQNAMLHLPGVHIGGDAIDRLPENLVTPPDHKMKQKQLSVFAATYNVMTLGPRGGSLFVQYLREQAVAHGLDILFLQETRSRHDQLVISATHYRYTAAAKDGVGGVEIWLTRERRKTGHAAFDKATTQVLHAAAQCLLLKTTLQGVTLLLLTFHAPHSGRGRHDIELFWQSLTSLVRPYVQKFPNLIVGADANAHFATELDGHIGYAGLEHATDHGGDCFRRFLLDFDLFIPSTFEHIHRGSHQTWWSFSAHKGARCDYFAVPKSWSTSFFQTEVKTSLDEGKAGIDHLPLTMHCKILFCTSVRVRSKEGFDRRSLQEATKEQIQGVLRDVQIPAWHEGIDQHAMKLVRQIHDRLCQEFPPKKRATKVVYL
ncbi:unnamed protein product [Durusdinium trenchii]|uniref:RNase H type-1 domain-containing protein n=1 Tax=Durusdinium trenchii TaxID=1381693 RepID=A0ABP0RTG5_9DINO